MIAAAGPTDANTLLGGRVRYRQLRHGYRTGIEPVLLAAAVPARPGQSVLEAGSGAGAALLCLAARVTGLHATGVEADPALAALARQNAADNADRTAGSAPAHLAVHALDVTALPPAWRGTFHHALANPPWHPDGTPSPDPGREKALRGATGLLASWTAALAACLRPRGTLTLILPAARLPEACAALAPARLGSARLCPLWPRAGLPARLVLLRAVRGGRGPAVLAPGLVLHQDDGFTPEAENILRAAAPLPF